MVSKWCLGKSGCCFGSLEVISVEKTSMFVSLFSCTFFSPWPSKGLKCRKSQNQKSTKVIFFFGARHHVIWSFWSQIDQLITMWTPTHQFQKLPFLPDYHPPLSCPPRRAHLRQWHPPTLWEKKSQNIRICLHCCIFWGIHGEECKSSRKCTKERGTEIWLGKWDKRQMRQKAHDTKDKHSSKKKNWSTNSIFVILILEFFNVGFS